MNPATKILLVCGGGLLLLMLLIFWPRSNPVLACLRVDPDTQIQAEAAVQRLALCVQQEAQRERAAQDRIETIAAALTEIGLGPLLVEAYAPADMGRLSLPRNDLETGIGLYLDALASPFRLETETVIDTAELSVLNATWRSDSRRMAVPVTLHLVPDRRYGYIFTRLDRGHVQR